MMKAIISWHNEHGEFTDVGMNYRRPVGPYKTQRKFVEIAKVLAGNKPYRIEWFHGDIRGEPYSVTYGNTQRNPNTRTATRTEVRSPTSTRTKTRAYTRGNVTVTGGAGSGSTSVYLRGRRNPSIWDRAIGDKKLTIAQAKSILKKYGVSIRKRDNEYRVNFMAGGTEATAYYTDDINDAVQTGLAMQQHRIQQSLPLKNPAFKARGRRGNLVSKKATTEHRTIGKKFVRLYNTNIVELHADGSVTLNSGGYITVTTKRRMNEVSDAWGLGFQLYAKKGDWYIRGANNVEVKFFDGITFNPQTMTGPTNRFGLTPGPTINLNPGNRRAFLHVEKPGTVKRKVFWVSMKTVKGWQVFQPPYKTKEAAISYAKMIHRSTKCPMKVEIGYRNFSDYK